MKISTLLFIFIILINPLCKAQNETSKWFFGNFAGLDFMSGSPVSVYSPTMLTTENISSIADANGNLLFYSNSEKVWDASHNIMANGSGLLGSWDSQQNFVVKKPGSNSIYYLFTLDHSGGPNGLMYHVLDMSLAAGMGSVTTKNIPLFSPCSEQVTATKHCNGTDVWVLAHDKIGNGFKTFLVSAAGVNTTAVTSAAGTGHLPLSVHGSSMKFSPNGSKLGMPLALVNQQTITTGAELFDFDNNTGIVSGAQTLPVINTSTLTNNGPYGCEFSPDGSKLYISQLLASNLLQFDLCNNNALTVIPSQFNGMTNYFGALQLALDGKIYLARTGNTNLGVINNPNATGTACNYNDIGPQFSLYGLMQPTAQAGLPSFLNSIFKKLPSFTYSENCQSAYFMAPPQTCSNVGASFSSVAWDFGDPASGMLNNSNLLNPMHLYLSTGNYNVKLILYYSCSTDTVKMPVTITTTGPSLSLSGPLTICRGQSATLTATGAQSYTWSTSTTGSVAVLSPTFSSIHSVTASNADGTCPVMRQFTIGVSSCTGIDQPDHSDINNVRIYPNPSSGLFTVDITKDMHLIIYNALGAAVYAQQLPNGKTTINIGHLSKGLYFAQLSDDSSVNTIKIVKTD